MKIVHSIIFAPMFIFIGLSSLVKFDVELNNIDAAEIFPFIIAMIGGIMIAAIFSIVLFWLYYALMESSSKQATPGKMVLNLKVTDINGGRISFARATGRYFGKIISSMTLLVGYIMAGFTSKKQALHDMIAECLVVKI